MQSNTQGWIIKSLQLIPYLRTLTLGNLNHHVQLSWSHGAEGPHLPGGEGLKQHREREMLLATKVIPSGQKKVILSWALSKLHTCQQTNGLLFAVATKFWRDVLHDSRKGQQPLQSTGSLHSPGMPPLPPRPPRGRSSAPPPRHLTHPGWAERKRNWAPSPTPVLKEGKPTQEQKTDYFKWNVSAFMKVFSVLPPRERMLPLCWLIPIYWW